MEVIQVQNLKKTFVLSKKQQKIQATNESKIVAVNDLSFAVEKGEIFGLLGPNGAGKTTTLRMLSTLIKPDSGDVLVDGSSVTKEPAVVREKIGFLTSELKLEDFFTPNYLFDFFSDLYHVPVEVRKARKAEIFERFGIAIDIATMSEDDVAGLRRADENIPEVSADLFVLHSFP